MRAAPPLQLTVDRFGVWRALLGALLATALAAIGLWLWLGRRQPFGAALSPGGLPALLAAAGLALGVAATRLRAAAFSLRWDGAAWHVGAPGSAPDEPWSGRVRVAVDLGGWLLLRFVPASGPRRCAYRWLALQRGAHAAQWHALRGAVYSARFNPPP